MIDIRKLVTTDYEAFRAIRVHMLESTTGNYSAGLTDWKNASQDQVVGYLRESESASDNFVLGAFETEMLGMVGFRRETRATLRHKGSIWGLYENPLFKKAKAEEGLLRKLIEIVGGYEGFEYIRTVQNAGNREKIDLFLSLGFRQYGLEERSLKMGEQYFDQAYLKLDLR